MRASGWARNENQARQEARKHWAVGLERGQWGLVQEQYLPAGKKTGPRWLTKQGAVGAYRLCSPQGSRQQRHSQSRGQRDDMD